MPQARRRRGPRRRDRRQHVNGEAGQVQVGGVASRYCASQLCGIVFRWRRSATARRRAPARNGSLAASRAARQSARMARVPRRTSACRAPPAHKAGRRRPGAAPHERPGEHQRRRHHDADGERRPLEERARPGQAVGRVVDQGAGVRGLTSSSTATTISAVAAISQRQARRSAPSGQATPSRPASPGRSPPARRCAPSGSRSRRGGHGEARRAAPSRT